MIYAIVLFLLVVSYGNWIKFITHKYVKLMFWVSGFTLAILVPQSDFRAESNIRFVIINLTVLVLLILHGQHFSTKFAEKAVFFTVTMVWQTK